MNCLSCSTDIADKDLTTEKWAIVTLTNLKQRGFFVTSGHVIVRGWQIEKVKDFDTNICSNCMDTHEEQEEQDKILKRKKYKHLQKKLNIAGSVTGALIIIGALLLEYLKSNGMDIPKDKEVFNFLIIFALICFVIPMIHWLFDPKFNEVSNDAVKRNFHKSYIDAYISQMSERLDKNILPLILHPAPLMPGPTKPFKGMYFTVPQSALSSYESTKKRTGWSRIDYFHRNGDGIEGKYDSGLQSENLNNFELKHWGEFLSGPPSQFESIAGFYEIAE